ncbi:acyl-CoA thioesterase [Saccharopolyspora sp. K220]|uniref:acyl-CoA thioesterase n=1 Tax=Saccharopolyspora soli TaxID=2926618 RepID=UPI001F562A36|nr:thioesterase family protein [Saccharopolyspora soli]MCI2420037.1 acyl-CoA thioesterase [Saccharopolyspora soli]
MNTLARADFPVLRPQQTRWSDNDVYGHVNNAAYYLWFDSTVNGWLMDTTGVDIRMLPAIGVVVETSCRFVHEVTFPDRLDIGLALEHRGRTSVRYRLGVFRDDLLCAHGQFVHVYVDPATRRPTQIPDLIGKALDTLA